MAVETEGVDRVLRQLTAVRRAAARAPVVEVYFGDTATRSGAENARIALDLTLRGFAPFFFNAREIKHTARVILDEARKGSVGYYGGDLGVAFAKAMEAIGRYAVRTLKRHITVKKTPHGAFPERKGQPTHPPLKRTGQLYQSPRFRLVRR